MIPTLKMSYFNLPSCFRSLHSPLYVSPSFLVECNSDSEDEVVVHKRRQQNKVNPLSSPEVVRKATNDYVN